MGKTKGIYECSKTFLELEDAIDKYIKRIEAKEEVHDIYFYEILDKGLTGADISEDLRALAFACLFKKVSISNIERMDHLKEQIDQIKMELYVFPLLDYARKYAGQTLCPNEKFSVANLKKEAVPKVAYLFTMLSYFIMRAGENRNLVLDKEEIKNLTTETFHSLTSPISPAPMKRYFAYELEYDWIENMIKDFASFVAVILTVGEPNYVTLDNHKIEFNEYLLGFLNYMYNRALYESRDTLRKITATQLIEARVRAKHKEELEELQHFIFSSNWYDYDVRTRIAELYKEYPDSVNTLAYAYGKSFDSVAEIVPSGVPEIDEEIAKMKVR